MNDNKKFGRRFTAEQKKFLLSYAEGHHYSEIIRAYNKLFPDEPLTSSRLKSFLYRNGVKTGIDAGFKAGHSPHNKGRSMTDYMSEESIEKVKATQFKKGHASDRTKPIGYERFDKDEYVIVKIGQPSVWARRSRLVYEQNYGEIPEGYVIRHLNGIVTDDSIDNLVAVSVDVNSRINHSKLFTDNSEINKAVINLERLKDKVFKITKKRGEK